MQLDTKLITSPLDGCKAVTGYSGWPISRVKPLHEFCAYHAWLIRALQSGLVNQRVGVSFPSLGGALNLTFCSLYVKQKTCKNIFGPELHNGKRYSEHCGSNLSQPSERERECPLCNSIRQQPFRWTLGVDYSIIIVDTWPAHLQSVSQPDSHFLFVDCCLSPKLPKLVKHHKRIHSASQPAQCKLD